MIELTQGLQCCLRCGRVLTDRTLHDLFEDAALEGIRAGRGDGAPDEEVCEPCVRDFRTLLRRRRTRSASQGVREKAGLSSRLAGWLRGAAGALNVSPKI